MKYMTTKVGAGCYEYRGYFIERFEDSREWRVGEIGEFGTDVVDTLNEGRLLVDYYNDTMPIIQAELAAYAEDLQRTVNNH